MYHDCMSFPAILIAKPMPKIGKRESQNYWSLRRGPSVHFQRIGFSFPFMLRSLSQDPVLVTLRMQAKLVGLIHADCDFQGFFYE